MKKLTLIAMLLLVTFLCSCFAQRNTSNGPTPNRPDLDLPLPDETEPYVPSESGKWQYDPDPYDEIKIYGGLSGNGMAYVSVDNNVCTLMIEMTDTDTSVKTTYTVSGLSLMPSRDPRDGSYTLFSEEYEVISAGNAVSSGKNFSVSVKLDDENGICTVCSIAAEDQNDGEVLLKHQYSDGKPIQTNITNKTTTVNIEYHPLTNKTVEKTTSTFDPNGKRIHFLEQGWYKDGEPYYLKESENGINTDHVLYYHKNGKLMSETYYVKGQSATESSKTYDEDGVLASEMYVEGDRRYDIAYFEDGKTVRSKQVEVIDRKTFQTLYIESSHRWYDADTLSSETLGNEYGYLKSTNYYSDGTLKKVVIYREGKKYSSHTQYKIVNIIESEKTYYKNGNPETEFRYDEKSKLTREYYYHENGNPKYLRDISADIETIVQYHGDSGVKSSEYVYYPKLDRDTTKDWYPNGVLRSEEEWVGGYRNAKSYYEDGSLMGVTVESYGRRETTRYYQSGVIESVYVHTPRVRTLTEYDENGKKIRFTHTDCEPDGTVLNRYIEEYE